MFLQRGIKVVHVGLMMLAVMDLHRHFVDVRFERVGRVRKRRKCVSHRNVLLVDLGRQRDITWCPASAGLYEVRLKADTTYDRRSKESYYEMESMRSSATRVQRFCSAGTTIRLWTSPAMSPSSTHKRWLGETRNIVEQRHPN